MVCIFQGNFLKTNIWHYFKTCLSLKEVSLSTYQIIFTIAIKQFLKKYIVVVKKEEEVAFLYINI